MFLKFIRQLTPFLLVCLVACLGTLYFVAFKDIKAGWQVVGLALLIILVILFFIDYLLKRVFKLSLLALWIIEIILLATGIYFWIIS
jgi:hypothetical protein